MGNKTDNNKKKFRNNIIIMTVGLIIFAALSSLILNFSFGIILFSLGIFVDGIATLAGASKQFLRSIRNPSLEDRTVESAMFFAGWIAVGISVPFLCQIMF